MMSDGASAEQGSASASKLWAALQAMPRPHRTVDFPRRTLDGRDVGQLFIRELTHEERMICAATAETFARKVLKDAPSDSLGYLELYARGFAAELLYRACRDAEDPMRPAFPSPRHVRELKDSETAFLFEAYVAGLGADEPVAPAPQTTT